MEKSVPRQRVLPADALLRHELGESVCEPLGVPGGRLHLDLDSEMHRELCVWLRRAVAGTLAFTASKGHSAMSAKNSADAEPARKISVWYLAANSSPAMSE
jgi:hypothetical protein